MPQTILRTAGLCKNYRGWPAVDHLDMQVEKGVIYGFIGRNGAGKSTTFKMLAGLARPSAGQIELFGQPLTEAAARRRLGVLIEDAGAYPGLSVQENCRLKAAALGLEDEKAAVQRVLEEVGLQDCARKACKRLSMGQRRRLGLALALLGSPDLLLLDEPTNGLDPEGIREVRSLLLRLQAERGVTIVISSHLLGELEKIATCYGILRAGRMVQQITAAELDARCRDYIALQTSEPHRAASALEETLKLRDYEVLPGGEVHIFGAADPAAVTAALAGAGVPVQGIGAHRQELEEYFLALMGVEEDA